MAIFLWGCVLFILGIVLGTSIAGLIECSKQPIGTLRIDQSDPSEEPYLFLELDKSIRFFQDEKIVRMRVKKENYISQK